MAQGASGKRSRVPLEIDNDISRIANNLEEEEETGILRTVQMGGNQALNDITDYNQDVDRMCRYCGEAVSTSDHIRWSCKHFDPVRKEVDAELASIPHKYFPSCVKNGIAPAMKADGQQTYWGAALGDDINDKTKRLLGHDCELQTPGSDARITEQREAASEICENPELEGYNARQIMLKHKGAHGSGTNLVFPGRDGIEGNMQGHPSEYKVNIYGDGSFTSPTVWWAALGGFGIWVPKWDTDHEHRTEATGNRQQHEQQTAHQQQRTSNRSYGETAATRAADTAPAAASPGTRIATAA